MFWRNLQGGSKYIQVYPNAEGVGKAVTPNYQRCKCEEMYRAASTLCPTLPGSVATRDRGGVQMQRNIIAKFAPVVLQQNGKQNQYPKQQITCCKYCIVLSYFFSKTRLHHRQTKTTRSKPDRPTETGEILKENLVLRVPTGLDWIGSFPPFDSVVKPNQEQTVWVILGLVRDTSEWPGAWVSNIIYIIIYIYCFLVVEFWNHVESESGLSMFIMVWTVLRYCIPLSHRLTLHRSTSTVVSPFQQRNKSSRHSELVFGIQ